MKRIWSILLALTLVASLALPAAAAENTASTMRLMETEGTVAAENSAGQDLSLWDGMRLYSGYQVSTEAASYAYIALDNSKTAKLDASSAAKVAQSGKQLELNATAGSLFFNVPVALKSGESMNIRTSNMVTGIRGTAGWVRVLDRYTTRVALLEGTATIHSRDPLTGENRSVTIHGGQIATIILHKKAAAMTQQLINQGVIIEENIVEELTRLGQVVEELQEDNVPGFVASEVAKDKDLQQRINAESPLNAAEIALNALERLAADEAAAGSDEDVRQQLDNIFANDTDDEDEVFTEPETIVITETEVIEKEVVVEVEKEVVVEVEKEVIKEVEKEVEVEVEVPTLDTDDPAAQDVQDSLDDYGVATATKADLDLADLTVDEGQVLNIVSGTLTNSGDSTVGGTINIFADAELVNEGAITVNSTDSIHVYGKLANTYDGEILIGGYDEEEEAILSGKLVVHSGGTLENDGVISMGDADSTFKVEAEGTLINNADGYIDFYPEERNFIVKGYFEDYANEVYSQARNGAVTYLGSFDEIALEYNPDYEGADPYLYDGETFKLLNAGTLTTYEYLTFPSDASLTLDMNGNEAELIAMVSTDDGGSTTEYNALFLIGDSGAAAVSSQSEAISYPMNLTLTDSVGGGELSGAIFPAFDVFLALEAGTVNGYIQVLNYAYFEMTGGTIVVPSFDPDDDLMNFSGYTDYCPGIYTEEAYFYMSGGTIDATADDTCALDLDPSSYRSSLVSGTLLGQMLLPYCEYVEYPEIGIYLPGYGSTYFIPSDFAYV